jgi:hypothetical protein
MDRSGTIVRTIDVPQDRFGPIPTNLVRLLADRSILATQIMYQTLNGWGPPEPRDSIAVLRFPKFARVERGDVPRDTVGILHTRLVLLPLGGDGRAVPHPWHHADQVAVSPDGARFVIARESDSGYTLSIYEPGRSPTSPVQRRTVSAPRRPISRIEIEGWAKRASFDLSYRGVTREQLVDSLVKVVGAVPYMSPVSGLVIGSDSTIWVRREAMDRHSGKGTPTVRWDVFDALGEPLAIVDLPTDARVLAIAKDLIWAVESEHSVSRLVQYRVRRSG